MINIKSIIKKRILGGKNPLISSIIAGAMIGAILSGMVAPKTTRAETFLTHTLISDPTTLIKDGYPTVKNIVEPSVEVVKEITMVVTAYSSTEAQTDSTPFVTASGKEVADGIVANNMLPFGAKVRIPELYDDKIFVVQDRMHQRKGKYHLDIWFPEYSQAKNFGAKITSIEVLKD